MKKRGRKFAEMSDTELIRMFRGKYETVHLVECFGTRDLIELNMAERELHRRGYEIRESLPEVVKAEPEEEEV